MCKFSVLQFFYTILIVGKFSGTINNEVSFTIVQNVNCQINWFTYICPQSLLVSGIDIIPK